MRTFMIIYLALTVGCASFYVPSANFSAEFVPMNIPQGKALVYLYVPAGIPGTAAIAIDNKFVTEIRSGGYFPYISEAGSIEIAKLTQYFGRAVLSQKELKINLVLEANKYYFVRYADALYLQKLQSVGNELGEPELKKTRLIISSQP